MAGYKGFDKDFKCRGMQYTVGETYKFDGAIEICECGFHFCDIPAVVFEYYPPVNSRYALIEATGEVVDGGKHKFCTDEIKIVRELTLTELADEIVKQAVSTESATGDCSAVTNTSNHSAATNTGDGSTATNTGAWSAASNTGDYSVATNTGYGSAATNTGNRSAATNTGNRSAATNTGNWSVAEVTGKNSVALVIGHASKAKGALGCWLVLGEWRDYELADVQCFRVDGELVKPNVFYTLKDGKPVAVDD